LGWWGMTSEILGMEGLGWVFWLGLIEAGFSLSVLGGCCVPGWILWCGAVSGVWRFWVSHENLQPAGSSICMCDGALSQAGQPGQARIMAHRLHLLRDVPASSPAQPPHSATVGKVELDM
jgi:hypothetical protein